MRTPRAQCQKPDVNARQLTKQLRTPAATSRSAIVGELYGKFAPEVMHHLCGDDHVDLDKGSRQEREPDYLKNFTITQAHDTTTKLAGTTSSFPTAAREREKQRKAAGIVAKKQKQTVEDHWDDLGDDLSGLGGDLILYMADTYIEKLEPDFLAEKITPEVEGLPILFFAVSLPCRVFPTCSSRAACRKHSAYY